VDRLLVAWREAGVTVLIASHATERLESAIDGEVVLERGLVAAVRGTGVVSMPLAPVATRPATAAAR
jgi:ABC-type Mn2+/Zn2+ transport system ATPase subunit